MPDGTFADNTGPRDGAFSFSVVFSTVLNFFLLFALVVLKNETSFALDTFVVLVFGAMLYVLSFLTLSLLPVSLLTLFLLSLCIFLFPFAANTKI